jgi:hypothetical protein
VESFRRLLSLEEVTIYKIICSDLILAEELEGYLRLASSQGSLRRPTNRVAYLRLNLHMRISANRLWILPHRVIKNKH